MPADSYSARLRLRLQATGGNPNTWGSLLNTADIQLVEDSIAGIANVVVAAADVTLSQNNGATDQARMAILSLTGAPTAAHNINIPAVSKQYLVINATGQTMTIQVLGAGGTTVAVPTGHAQLVYCDGTNVAQPEAIAAGTAANSAELGGVPAASYARLDIANLFDAGNAVEFETLTDAATVTMNCLLSNNFYLLIGGNRTLSITNPEDGQRVELWVQQDGVGSRTLAFPGTVNFDQGSSATLTTNPNAIDRFFLTWNNALGIWRARLAPFAVSGGTAVTLSQSLVEANLWKLLGSPAAGTFNVTIAAGVSIVATSAGNPALDLTGFPATSIVNITNLGYILGRGGDGGEGGEIGGAGSTITTWNKGKKGKPGGTALKGPGAGITVNLTNVNGFIWGGGGGGGGGGAQKGGSPSSDNGGGGGGGAGGGKGGPEGATDNGVVALASAGTDGGTGPDGTFGAGGAGAAAGGGQAGTGGAGGDWGSPGATGQNFGSGSFYAVPGTGGAAGKAIDLAGGSVNILSGGGAPNIKGAIL
jgi:hypothetical protein